MPRTNSSKTKDSVRPACGGWPRIALDCWLLSAEASIVVPLRLARILMGGAGAKAEAKLMVSEKVEAHGALISDLAKGRLGSGAAEVTGGVVSHYLTRVRANRVRLTGIGRS